MDDIRYGFYMRPCAEMCRAQAEIHDLLDRQYGLRVAGRFMPHATIKGFFRSDSPVAELVAALDPALSDKEPVRITAPPAGSAFDRGPGATSAPRHWR